MEKLRWLIGGLLLATIAINSAGCALIHEMQWHRLHRFNRGDELGGGTEAYFSVADPVSTKPIVAELPDATD